MKDGFLRVACASFEVKIASVESNSNNVIKLIDEANNHNTQLLVFPELTLTGYSLQDLFFQARVLNEAKKQIIRIKEYSKDKNMVIVVGMPLEVKNKLYNCGVVIFNNRILGIVPKTYLPNYHEFYEARHFCKAPDGIINICIGNELVPFGTNIIFEDDNNPYLKIALEICEDVWAPLPPSTMHCLNGATLIVNPSASNDLTAKSDYRRQLISTHSASSICGYVYTNAGLGESSTDVVFSGHHIICENGVVLNESKQYCNGIIYADMDLEKLYRERLEMNTYENRFDDYLFVHFSLDDIDLDLNRYYDPHPFVPSNPTLRKKRCEEVFNIQMQGLIQRIRAIGVKKVVIGISGGLDSTLALLVAKMAYERLGYPLSNIIAVTMPCFGTTSRTKNNALEMMKECHVTSYTVDISKAVLQHFNDIKQDPNIHNVTYENCQARERTQVLMDIANKEGGIVIGTGDLSEVALGWSTYNGDHMSMYAVNVSVPKTLVRYLVDYVSSLYKGEKLEAILQDILDTPVSPELIPANDDEIVQKTEDIVGPYELHDFFLYHHVRFHFEPKKLYRIACLTYLNKYDKLTIKKWLTLFYRRFFTQQFKRSCIPDGPKVGSVALSPRGDLRMPSDSNVESWLKKCEEL